MKERIRFDDRYPVPLRPTRPATPALQRPLHVSTEAPSQNNRVWQDFILMLRRSAGHQG